MHPGDVVILIGYGQYDDAEAKSMRPSVVFVDGDNRPVHSGGSPTAIPDETQANGLRVSAFAAG